MLAYATATGQPVTIGELLTIGGGAATKNMIAKPVLIITGQYDVPFCGGNCLAAPTGYTSIPETSKMYLPNASPFKVDIVMGAGHGLNYQYTHPTTYKDILDFFASSGVGPMSSGKAPAGKPPGAMNGHWGTKAAGDAVPAESEMAGSS